MTHTYRDSDVLEYGALPFFLFPLVLCVGFVALTIAAGPEWGVPLGAFAGLVSVGAFVTYRRHRYGTCGEIRLDGDGTCELETPRRTIRLRVNEITSVRFWSETDERSESYTIHYHGGKLAVTKQMPDFADFLIRLETLNPAVDLTSFPADAWRGVGTPPTEERGAGVGRRVLGALFPVTVVVVMVWLMLETFAGAR